MTNLLLILAAMKTHGCSFTEAATIVREASKKKTTKTLKDEPKDNPK